MKNWPIIEEKINAFLTWFFGAVWAFLVKSTPQVVKDKYTFIKNKILTKIINTKNKIINFFVNLKNKILGSIKYVKVESREATKGILKKVDQFKKLRIKDLHPKVWLNPLVKNLKTEFIIKKEKVVLKVNDFGVKNIVLMSVLSLIGIGILTQVFLQSRKMLINSGVMRDPASVSNTFFVQETRPRYYKRDEKQLLIKNIRFPVYVGESSKSHAVTIDLNVITSNKYLRAYLDENHHLVNDIFNTKMEPIIPSFPLEAEGKIILKEKVKKELNKLIKELKIDGYVEEVQIHSITSG